jgi:hypothetical protein
MALGQDLGRRLQTKVHPEPSPAPKAFLQCGLRSNSGLVVVYLDATAPVRGRYLSRIDGIRQDAGGPANDLRPIADLGEGLDGEAGAYWLPSISSLYAYRADGWMTVLYPVRGQSGSERRDGAVALGRRAFALTDR